MQDQQKRITSALISVYHKQGLEHIVQQLIAHNVTIYSTGGTYEWIRSMQLPVVRVEDITAYPSILGGRVKTLHPKIFGGILARRDNPADQAYMDSFALPYIDLVIVDLYPFEETLASGAQEDEIIEKIDIGGISLIRAAAKNHKDVLVVASSEKYMALEELLEAGQGFTTLPERKDFARHAFAVSSAYDAAIFRYFDDAFPHAGIRLSNDHPYPLRYGENPHQTGKFFGDLDGVFTQLHGKALSYNNLMDLDAAVQLIREFDSPTFAILKHNNACGIASRSNIIHAWKDALAADPVSAYGGVLICNTEIEKELALDIDNIFFEIIAAPSYTSGALEILQLKKNRIILQTRPFDLPNLVYRSILNGVLVQSRDTLAEDRDELQVVSLRKPEVAELEDMLFAARIVKHTRSNAIVLAKGRQLLGSGMGQTSRVDALRQAIQKALSFGLDLQGAVMASDAFFPFADSVEIAHQAGIKAVIQPGGSIRDEASIRFCDDHDMSMVFSGVRHFRH